MTISHPVSPSVSKPVSHPAKSASLENEKDLVLLAQAGDREAQGELIQLHRRSVFYLALQLVGNKDDAFDIAQDSLLRFISSLHRFDARRPVRPWLFQIVRNRAMDLHRHRKVRRHVSLESGPDDERPRFELVDNDVDVEADLARSQLRARVWEALTELTDRQREILVLRDYQDLSYAEIAETLSIPIGTVMSRLHAARSKLRLILKDELRSLLPCL